MKCETYDERMTFINENGIELTDDQMEALSAGGSTKGEVVNYP